MSTDSAASVTKLVIVLKEVAPHVSLFQQGGLAKKIAEILKRPTEGEPLSESDSTFQFLLRKCCDWLKQQPNSYLGELGNRKNQDMLLRNLRDFLPRCLQEDSGSSQPQTQTVSASVGSSNDSNLSAATVLHFEEKGKTSSKLQGRVVRVMEDQIVIKPIVEEVKIKGCVEEVFISKQNVNVGEFKINPSVGDVISFKISQRNRRQGYAADLCRIKNMEPSLVVAFVHKLEEMARKRSREALMFVSSCKAVWTYICDMPSLDQQVVRDILKFVSHVTTRHTVSCAEARLVRFMKTLANSRFSAIIIQRHVKCHVKLPFDDEAILIQNFILAVIRYVPERSSRLLPLLDRLAGLVFDKQLFAHLDSSGKPAEFGKFMLNAFRHLTKAIPGVTDDVHSLSWDQLSLVPTSGELTDVNCEDFGLLPSVLTDKQYDSEDDYVETYFRLLRADCFQGLTAGIQMFLNGRFDHRDMAVYSINLDGVQMTNSGIALSIYFKPLGRKAINWKYSNLLMFGNLVCLTANGTFKEPIWAMVLHRSPELLEKGIVFLSLNSDHNRLSEAEIIMLLQNSQFAIMAESPTYYRAYGPVLRCLQDKRNGVPFQDELVQLLSGGSPQYLENASVDWSLIFNKKSVRTQCQDLMTLQNERELSQLWDTDCVLPVEYFDELVDRNVSTTLDETQLSAIRTFLDNRVTIIQGPPGTGKSYIGAKIANLVLSMPQRPQGPILVLTYKNHALDQFLQDCLQFTSDVVRVGGRSTNEVLQEKNIHELRKVVGIPGDLSSRLKETRRELAELKEQFPSLLCKLKDFREFDVCKFVKVASIYHISELCDKCPQKVAALVESKYMEKTQNLIKQSKSDVVLRDLLMKHPESRAALSTLLHSWAPSEDYFLTSFKEECKWQSLLDVAESTNSDDQYDDEEDVENMYEDRLLSQDVSARLTAGKWRDPQQGFVSMRYTKATGIAFKRTVPYISDLKDVMNRTTGSMWDLTTQQRAQLIFYWMSCLEETNANDEIVEIVEDIEQLSSELNELEAEVSARVLQNASIVGMTTTGAAIHAALINMVSPEIIIVEEAAEILEAQLLAVLPASVQHLIMIGDHQQLRPQVQCYTLRRNHGMDISMFERLIKHLPSSQLGYQCRMRKEFVELIRPLYPNLKTHHELVKWNDAPSCIASSMFFWTHTHCEQQSKHSRSWQNLREAEKVMQILQWLLKYNFEPKKITILCSYRGQLQEIRSKLKVLKVEGVVTSTIDRYQGDENDIVLVSLVRTSRLGFLREPNRMCVAASRARKGVYFFGNAVLLSSRNCCWQNLISHMKLNELCGTSFPFVCPVHTGNLLHGNICKLVCNIRRVSCDHVCKNECHGLQPHPMCKEIVEFRFSCGHNSSRECCKNERDLYCRKELRAKHPSCGHIFTYPCFRHPSEFQCKLKCERLMSCGHPCPLKCHEICSTAVNDCKSCAEELEKERQQQIERNRRKIELLKWETEEKLKQVKHKPIATEVVDRTHDLYRTMQHQVSQFLPDVGRKSAIVSSIHEIQNSELLKNWLKAKLQIPDYGQETYKFKFVNDQQELNDIARTGLAAYERKDWRFTKQHVMKVSELDRTFALIRFAVLQPTTRCVKRTRDILQQSEQLPESNDREIKLSSADHAHPDYIVHCKVKEKVYSNKGELGMTLQKDYFDRRVLSRPSAVSDGTDRLDDLRFREAEAEFLRMLPVGMKVDIVEVDYIDNGNLNIRYTEKKRTLSCNGACKESFVFHKTNEASISEIVKEGFKIGGQGIEIKNGAVYGQGIYTVEDPSVAMTYSQKSGANRVILCRVVYHHQGARPDIFVIKSQEQILPQYVVKYEITGELGMTLEAGHFCMRELMPFQKLMSGYARLDDLLYREAESQFLRMLPVEMKARVRKVEHIDNGTLNVQYNNKKKLFKTLHKNTEERFVFHGTDDCAISNIVKEGFKIGGQGIEIRNGAVYGQGVYTVEDPAVAISYARSSSKVLLCRVLQGKKGEDYNIGARKDIFVIKSKEQILPQFVVHFEKT